jgi:hypothetical protein
MAGGARTIEAPLEADALDEARTGWFAIGEPVCFGWMSTTRGADTAKLIETVRFRIV